MLTSEITAHMLKCIVRGHVCCPLIHDSSFHSFHDEGYLRLMKASEGYWREMKVNEAF